jgi:hypothetical protein
VNGTLIMAAEGRGAILRGRVGMLKAMNHGPGARGKRKLKRDE